MTPLSEAQRTELWEVILNRLPERQAELVRRVYREGESVTSAAAAVGTSERTASDDLAAAIKHLSTPFVVRYLQSLCDDIEGDRSANDRMRKMIELRDETRFAVTSPAFAGGPNLFQQNIHGESRDRIDLHHVTEAIDFLSESADPRMPIAIAFVKALAAEVDKLYGVEDNIIHDHVIAEFGGDTCDDDDDEDGYEDDDEDELE